MAGRGVGLVTEDNRNKAKTKEIKREAFCVLTIIKDHKIKFTIIKIFLSEVHIFLTKALEVEKKNKIKNMWKTTIKTPTLFVKAELGSCTLWINNSLES